MGGLPPAKLGKAEDPTKQTNKNTKIIIPKTTLHPVKDRWGVWRKGLNGPTNKHRKKTPRAGVVTRITHQLVSLSFVITVL